MVATLHSTEPDADRCPRCGEKLAEPADLRKANALLHGLLTNREADLRAALGEASMLARKSERLRAAGLSIIKANDEFRAGLPDGWDGDPLNDTCEAARALFTNEQSAPPEGDNDPNGNRDLAREIDG